MFKMSKMANGGDEQIFGSDKNHSNKATLINLPIVDHPFSFGTLCDFIIANLIRIPVSAIVSSLYYVIHGPIVLKRKYNVSRKRINIPSRQTERDIKVDAYLPNNLWHSNRPLPVHVNWHGSGFVLNCFGVDGDFCAYMANKMQCIVLDVDYRKAPEFPFPACLQDSEDVMKSMFHNKHHHLYDQLPPINLQHISIGGSSAGGLIALGMGILFGGKKICAVATIAPPTDCRDQARYKKAPQPNHSMSLPQNIVFYFDRCYLLPNVNRENPVLSPVLCDLQKGQLDCKLVYTAAGTGDTLHNDSYNLIKSPSSHSKSKVTAMLSFMLFQEKVTDLKKRSEVNKSKRH
ncbi:alpha/beta-hydrolase [Meira miltonrushii]|uniref:Alpha/beta-hydrolase n=1 Tax=Meira miltonrushii TaxID=1280837 RepID=A0A316VPZ5_9BASI|nr:alpha/beta-hydrolase [Meira miltonrushii]PWN38483.1 alpha/beta-hydrolase [Meira miltonrushii]